VSINRAPTCRAARTTEGRLWLAETPITTSPGLNPRALDGVLNYWTARLAPIQRDPSQTWDQLGLDFSLEVIGFEMGEIDLRIARWTRIAGRENLVFGNDCGPCMRRTSTVDRLPLIRVETASDAGWSPDFIHLGTPQLPTSRTT
jgi:hypothetical protein